MGIKIVDTKVSRKYLKGIQERAFEMFRTADNDRAKTIWLDLVNAAERAKPLCVVENPAVKLRQRTYNKEQHLLINPAQTEQIDFHEGFHNLDVWIQYTDQESRWKEEIYCEDDSYKLLIKLQKRSDMFTPGKESFQRFLITCDYLEEPPETKFLGAIKFTRNGGKELSDSLRMSFWYTQSNQSRRLAGLYGP